MAFWWAMKARRSRSVGGLAEHVKGRTDPKEEAAILCRILKIEAWDLRVRFGLRILNLSRLVD